jgi:starvation-inducible DNA-binding protein
MNHIGLDTEQSKNLANKLNNLLAAYQLFYINIRGLHWNIKGEKFFELHVKFEELYNDSFLKIDEIAERIVTLGETPLHSYTAYLENSSIKETTDVSEAREAVQTVLNGFTELLKLEREILSLSADAEDEGTNALMSDYIREHEKSVWMYSAFLK